MLWRGAHQHGDAPGRTGARAAATSKLATGRLTRVWKQDRKKEREKTRVVIEEGCDGGQSEGEDSTLKFESGLK